MGGNLGQGPGTILGDKDIPDTVKSAWVKGGMVNLNGTQGSLKNWASGGDKFSMAINSYFNYFFFYSA